MDKWIKTIKYYTNVKFISHVRVSLNIFLLVACKDILRSFKIALFTNIQMIKIWDGLLHEVFYKKILADWVVKLRDTQHIDLHLII